MTATRIIYYLLVLLCISISLYLTYFGFLRTFQGLTMAFTAVIGLMLLGADLLIQRNRERGEPWMAAFFLFLLAATFSSASNFNYLYSNFMTRDVLASTLREQYKVFSDDLISTRTELGNISDVVNELDRRTQVEGLLNEVWLQMTDSNRPGCSTRCVQIMDQINGILGVQITELSRPRSNATQAEFSNFFNNYKSLIEGALDSISAATPYQTVVALQNEITSRLNYYGAADDAINAGANLDILANLSTESQDFQRRANALLPQDQEVEHEFIDPTLGRLGEIVYTLRNGFVEIPNLAATIMSFILSILVDFVPVIFAFVAFRQGESTFPEQSSNEELDFLN